MDELMTADDTSEPIASTSKLVRTTPSLYSDLEISSDSSISPDSSDEMYESVTPNEFFRKLVAIRAKCATVTTKLSTDDFSEKPNNLVSATQQESVDVTCETFEPTTHVQQSSVYSDIVQSSQSPPVHTKTGDFLEEPDGLVLATKQGSVYVSGETSESIASTSGLVPTTHAQISSVYSDLVQSSQSPPVHTKTDDFLEEPDGLVVATKPGSVYVSDETSESIASTSGLVLTTTHAQQSSLYSDVMQSSQSSPVHTKTTNNETSPVHIQRTSHQLEKLLAVSNIGTPVWKMRKMYSSEEDLHSSKPLSPISIVGSDMPREEQIEVSTDEDVVETNEHMETFCMASDEEKAQEKMDDTEEIFSISSGEDVIPPSPLGASGRGHDTSKLCFSQKKEKKLADVDLHALSSKTEQPKKYSLNASGDEMDSYDESVLSSGSEYKPSSPSSLTEEDLPLSNVKMVKKTRAERDTGKVKTSKQVRKKKTKKQDINDEKKMEYRKHEKQTCGIDDCGMVVFNLKRHLVTCHFLSDTKATRIVQQKRIESRMKKTCPLECGEKVQRLDTHLEKVHLFKRKSPQMNRLLKAARCKSRRERINRKRAMSKVKAQEATGLTSDQITCITERGTKEVKIPIEDVMEDFEKYLTGLDGEGTKPKDAAELRRKIQTSIDSTNGKMESLFNRELMKNVIEIAMKTHKPSTTTSYIHAFKRFYTYALFAKLQPSDLCNSLIVTMKNWARSLRKARAAQKAEHQEKVQSELLTPEELHNFEKSEVAKNAYKLVNTIEMDDITLISEEHFNNIRNVICAQLLINNGCRAGPIRTMKITNFKRAVKIEDHYCILIPIHKTTTSSGCQRVILDPKLHQLMSLYLQNVLRRTPSGTNDCDPLFPTYFGSTLDSSSFSKNIKKTWDAANITQKQLSATHVRKSIVTSMMQTRPELTPSLGKHMGHSLSTQQSHYALTIGVADSLRVTKQIKEARRSYVQKVCYHHYSNDNFPHC